MTVPKPHVQNNGAHPFSEKERTAFFRLWAIRESLPVRDRAFLDGLSVSARLTAAAGIRLMALDSDTGNVRAHNVDDYRRRRDRGDGLAPHSDSLTEKIARRRAAKAERDARKAANDAALDALPAGQRMALLEERARNAARRRSEFAALSPEQKVERKAILAAERRAHWQRSGGG